MIFCISGGGGCRKPSLLACTENASWSDELLAKNFQILERLDLNFDLDITGFDYGDIEQLLILGEDNASQAEHMPIIDPAQIVTE